MVAVLKTQQRLTAVMVMGLTDEEIQLLLAGVFVLDITRSTRNEDGEAIKVLASKLGGDPECEVLRECVKRKAKESMNLGSLSVTAPRDGQVVEP